MNVRVVTFAEYQRYYATLLENDASRVIGLPKTKTEFEDWWKRISVSDELCHRWKKRIHLGDLFIDSIADEIAAIKRAA